MSSVIPTGNKTRLPNEVNVNASLAIIEGASSVTASAISSVSFNAQGGTLKRNVKGKSDVWLYFQIYHEKKFHTHAFCLLCESDVNHGQMHSTSNLDKHLQRHHAKEYETIMVERAKKKSKLEANSGVQTKLTPFLESPCKDYEAYLLDWMIDSYQPLSAVQKESFRRMVQCLNPKAPVIGQDRIRSLMSMKYFETLQAITAIVKGKNFALTTDAWTSTAKVGYVTCTIHFIEPMTWTLHDFSLGIFKKDGNSKAVDVVHYAEEHIKNLICHTLNLPALLLILNQQ
jgi:hypothetical protein